MHLATADAKAIAGRVRALEDACGVEVVTLVVGKSDVYPEIVWKAFALGASLAALIATLVDAVRPDWILPGALLLQAVTILGAGAACALATLALPRFARLFLREARAALEVRQYAEVEFLSRELFATPQRTAVLILVSLLERRVVVLPDRGFQRRVGQAQWDGLVATMTAGLAMGAPGAALIAGLDRLRAIVMAAGFASTDATNRFADAPQQGPGA